MFIICPIFHFMVKYVFLRVTITKEVWNKLKNIHTEMIFYKYKKIILPHLEHFFKAIEIEKRIKNFSLMSLNKVFMKFILYHINCINLLWKVCENYQLICANNMEKNWKIKVCLKLLFSFFLVAGKSLPA